MPRQILICERCQGARVESRRLLRGFYRFIVWQLSRHFFRYPGFFLSKDAYNPLFLFDIDERPTSSAYFTLKERKISHICIYNIFEFDMFRCMAVIQPFFQDPIS